MINPAKKARILTESNSTILNPNLWYSSTKITESAAYELMYGFVGIKSQEYIIHAMNKNFNDATLELFRLHNTSTPKGYSYSFQRFIWGYWPIFHLWVAEILPKFIKANMINLENTYDDNHSYYFKTYLRFMYFQYLQRFDLNLDAQQKHFEIDGFHFTKLCKWSARIDSYCFPHRFDHPICQLLYDYNVVAPHTFPFYYQTNAFKLRFVFMYYYKQWKSQTVISLPENQTKVYLCSDLIEVIMSYLSSNLLTWN